MVALVILAFSECGTRALVVYFVFLIMINSDKYISHAYLLSLCFDFPLHVVIGTLGICLTREEDS